MYLPARNVSVQVVLPRFGTLVFLETPGPFRWKLSFAEASLTTIEYWPRLSDLTMAVPFLSVIELPATLPVSFVTIGGGAPMPTVKVLCIWSGWKSHW